MVVKKTSNVGSTKTSQQLALKFEGLKISAPGAVLFVMGEALSGKSYLLRLLANWYASNFKDIKLNILGEREDDVYQRWAKIVIETATEKTKQPQLKPRFGEINSKTGNCIEIADVMLVEGGVWLMECWGIEFAKGVITYLKRFSWESRVFVLAHSNRPPKALRDWLIDDMDIIATTIGEIPKQRAQDWAGIETIFNRTTHCKLDSLPEITVQKLYALGIGLEDLNKMHLMDRLRLMRKMENFKNDLPGILAGFYQKSELKEPQ